MKTEATYEVELDGIGGIEVFDYATRQDAEAGLSRLVKSAQTETSKDRISRIVRLVVAYPIVASNP